MRAATKPGRGRHRRRAISIAATATALAVVSLPLGTQGIAAAQSGAGSGTATSGYRVTATVNVGVHINDVAVDPGTGRLYALDSVPEGDGNLFDDATLSSIEVGPAADGMFIYRKTPTIGILNKLTVNPATSQLYLDFVSPPFRSGFYSEGIVDETTGRFVEGPDISEGCGYIGAIAYDPKGRDLLRQFSECGHTISGSGYSLESTDDTSAIAASTNGRVYGLDPAHGRLAVYVHPNRDPKPFRTVAVPRGTAHGMLALDEPRHLVIAASGNRITALDDRTGRTVKTGTVAGPVADIGVDPGTATLYVSGPDGLTIVDTRTGIVVKQITALGSGGAISVDAEEHIAFVAFGTRVAAITSGATRQ